MAGKQIDGLGLSYAFPGKSPRFSQVQSNGPGGGSGMLICSGDGVPRYDAKSQRWVQRGKFWAGIRDDDPPTPESLARKEQIDGHWCELGDGNDWLVPTVRKCPSGTALPQAIVGFGEQPGEYLYEIVSKYATIWDKTADLFASFMAALKGEPVELDDPVELAAEALSINYRVSMAEVCLLRLFTTANLWQSVLGAIIDWPAWLECAKSQSPPNDAPTEAEGQQP